MQSPFKFGKIVEGRFFTNRAKDIERMLANFQNDINTVLISPRRWGKSSLVIASAEKFTRENRNNKVIYIDLFNIKNESQFYAYYTKQVIKQTSSKPKEWIDTAKQFLKKISPKVTIPVANYNDFELSFEIKEGSDDFEEILNLPERIAKSKNCKFAVCIDEFQNIARFEDPVLIQNRMRASWQKHKSSVYCIYGSQTHMMQNLFQSQSMPFYKFGDLFYLKKIDTEHFIKFIRTGYERTNKTIDIDAAELITSSMECHPYYVQQLAHLTWQLSQRRAAIRDVNTAINELITYNASLYQKEIDGISNTQINFLVAMIKGVKHDIYHNEIIQKYDLGTTGNVKKIIDALLKKEIIHKPNGFYDFIDPAFKLWFRNVYVGS